MAGLGLIGSALVGGIGGAGEGMANVAIEEQKAEMLRKRDEYLAKLQAQTHATNKAFDADLAAKTTRSEEAVTGGILSNAQAKAGAKRDSFANAVDEPGNEITNDTVPTKVAPSRIEAARIQLDEAEKSGNKGAIESSRKKLEEARQEEKDSTDKAYKESQTRYHDALVTEAGKRTEVAANAAKARAGDADAKKTRDAEAAKAKERDEARKFDKDFKAAAESASKEKGADDKEKVNTEKANALKAIGDAIVAEDPAMRSNPNGVLTRSLAKYEEMRTEAEAKAKREWDGMAGSPRAAIGRKQEDGITDWDMKPDKGSFEGISGPDGKKESQTAFVERRSKEIFEQSIRATKKAEPKPLNTAMPAGEGLVSGAKKEDAQRQNTAAMALAVKARFQRGEIAREAALAELKAMGFSE